MTHADVNMASEEGKWMSIQEHFDNEFKINGSFVYVTGAWIDSKDNSGKPLCL